MGIWAPVVYSPTFRVDFRLLAAPPALASGSGRMWLMSFMRPTLHASDLLRESSRWALFQNESWRVFGATCRASALAARNERRTSDDRGRPLSLFVGYAAVRDRSGSYPPPAAYDASLAPFKQLYTFVLDHWDEIRPTPPDEVAQCTTNFPAASRRSGAHLPQLNFDTSQIALWPDTPEDRIHLWQAAGVSTDPQSLLLGFDQQRYALGTPYLNGATTDTAIPTRLPKPWSA